LQVAGIITEVSIPGKLNLRRGDVMQTKQQKETLEERAERQRINKRMAEWFGIA
jgi:hypothetical protein